jgi:hypothetical protein
MSDFLYNKIDFIIMIVLALLVAFIIGFNIIQIIDSKLSSVTINVPPQNCQIPPIYLSVDKESGDFKQIKLNDIVSVASNESIFNSIDDGLENFSNTDINNNSNINNVNENSNTNKQIENFGGIQDYPLLYDDDRRNLISDTINSDLGMKIINSKTKQDLATDPNYNTVNDIPLLVAPDTNVPNRAGPTAKGYYASKVKLIEDPNSPLMKLARSNAQKINQTVSKCTLADSSRIPQVNGTFDGYNAFVDLRTDSYANVTSIGKSMLSPYTSYPVPS